MDGACEGGEGARWASTLPHHAGTHIQIFFHTFFTSSVDQDIYDTNYQNYGNTAAVGKYTQASVGKYTYIQL